MPGSIRRDPRALRPDQWPNPYHTSRNPDRAVPPELAGYRDDPSHAETIAAAGMGNLAGPSETTREDAARTAALQRAIERSRPRLVRLGDGAVAVAGVATVLDLDGPVSGDRRIVRRINVGPTDYAGSVGSLPTGITTIAAIVPFNPELGGTVGQGAGAIPDSALQVVSVTSAFPAEGTWGRDELTLLPGDFLAVIVVGLAAGYAVSAGGQAYDVARATATEYTL
jgi:hypothetical protein